MREPPGENNHLTFAADIKYIYSDCSFILDRFLKKSNVYFSLFLSCAQQLISGECFSPERLLKAITRVKFKQKLLFVSLNDSKKVKSSNNELLIIYKDEAATRLQLAIEVHK